MKRAIGAAAATLIALALVGCGPTQEHTDCVAAGGEWTRHFSHFIIVGKTLIPQYRYTCEGLD